MAIDGQARLAGGERIRFATDAATAWTCRVQSSHGDLGPPNEATILGPARTPFGPWPATVYRGVAVDNLGILRAKLGWIAGSWAIAVGLATGGVVGSVQSARRRGEAAAHATDRAARRIGRLLMLPAAVLLAALLVENSWNERHEALLFRLPYTWPAILVLAAGSPLALARLPRRAIDGLIQLPRSRAWWPLLVVLLVGCGVLRIYKLDFQPLDDDEYASCQAVVGIARTGAPAFVPEGVYYTRSPAYHYLIGAIVWAFGENLWAMRLPCAAFGVATALLAYRLAERLMRSPWVGLGTAFFFSIHPFAIFSSHLVRFYQQQQFFALLAVYWFHLGFAGAPSQKYRYLTVLAFLVAVLSQEITAIMVFQLAIGLFLLGRDAGWPSNIRLAIVTAVALGFIVLDLVVFQTLCLTRTEGVSPNVEASIKPHFWDPYNFASLFLGYSRLHVAPSLILLAALPLLVARGGRIAWTLLFFLASGVALTNLMVSHVSLRYQYWLIPLWLLLTLRGLGLLVHWVSSATGSGGTRDDRRVAALLTLPLLLAFLLDWAPWRIADSYDSKILNDSTGAFRFVRGQLRPGDAIAANEPHPHAAYLEAGRVDYDLTVPLLHDFVMLKGGRLIDRNGGAETIASLDDLVDACKRHERLWVVVNREKFRTRGKNLRWEYPGARIELFLRKNMRVAYRSYMWTVFLWDQSEGHYAPFREH
ncbi:MAG: glycosyltransferase family 39 protein [Isosphaeraceae bacterium]